MQNLGKLFLIFSLHSLFLQACGQDQKSETKGKGQVQTVASLENRNPDGTISGEQLIRYQTAADGSHYSDRIQATTQPDGTIIYGSETTVWNDGQNEFPVCQEGMASSYKDDKGRAWHQDPDSQAVCKVIEP